MNIIFYCAGKNGNFDNLSLLTAYASRSGSFEFHKDIEALSHRLQQPHKNKAVAVICTETCEDLIDIYLIRHLLRGISLILILPDNERDTLAMGSLLRPVFTFSINNCIQNINNSLQMIMGYEKPDVTVNHLVPQREDCTLSFVKTFQRAA